MKNRLEYRSTIAILGALLGSGSVCGETIILNQCESLKIETSFNENCKYVESISFQSGPRQAGDLHSVDGRQKITYDLTVRPPDFIQPSTGYAYVGWVPDNIRSNVSTQSLSQETMPAAFNHSSVAGLPSDGFNSNTPAELSKVPNSEYSHDNVISGPLFASILALIGIVAVSRRNVS